MRGDVPGKQLLADFLKTRGLSYRAAAGGIGVSHPAIMQWLDGTARPSAAHRAALERWTNGDVPATSWLEAHEREHIEELEPYREEDPDEAPPASGPAGETCEGEGTATG